jgi:hypothetical protein
VSAPFVAGCQRNVGVSSRAVQQVDDATGRKPEIKLRKSRGTINGSFRAGRRLNIEAAVSMSCKVPVSGIG